VHLDVYNMQLSNQPAEELAKVLIASSNGAFELCGFVSGGMFIHSQSVPGIQLLVMYSGSEAMEGVIKLARQVYVPASR
jgi:E3 ubiquitin-protein ligase TRIP12